MAIQSYRFSISTHGFTDVHDVTGRVGDCVRKSGITNGIVIVFVPGSTAGITTIEFERGAVEDLQRAIERIAPQEIAYAHDARWDDGNGFAHVRAALLGPSLAIPLRNGELLTGTWQQIVLVDFDNRPRKREIVVTVTGD
jgi:secondary thiamine-phosphate synthase enzyme